MTELTMSMFANKDDMKAATEALVATRDKAGFGPFTHGEVEAATLAMVADMFAPHELPIDADLWDRYYATAKNALEAAARFRADSADLKGGEEVRDGKLYGWTGRRCGECGGHGARIDAHEEKKCSSCGGTGDEWGLMPNQPTTLTAA